MNKEIHLFIIWLNAYEARDKIIEDIQSRFTIKSVYEIHWSSEYFSSNLSRFYGGKLPPSCPKETRIGHGPFMLVVVEDESPAYGERDTGRRGVQTVNTNTFDAKMLYRSWTEGPDKVPDLVHATNTPQETSRDLTLLLGCNPKDYCCEPGRPPWDGAIERLNVDLVGAEGWSDINQLFYVLNSTIRYVVLRKFESLPDDYPLAHEEDIDLLVDNYKEACWIMDAKPVTDKPYRILNQVEIAGQSVRFDLRYVGDNYYDKCWQRNILKNRVLDPGGFYRPNDEDHFYTLLYHAIIQKPAMSDEYREKLTRMASGLGISGIGKRVLDDYMERMWYEYVEPVDKSVYYKPKAVRVEGQRKNIVYRGVRKLWIAMGRPKQLKPLRNYVGKYARLIGEMSRNIHR